MTVLRCVCGHVQVLHMGPTGPCRASEPDYDGTTYKAHLPNLKCPCAGFVLSVSERERADLG